MTKFKVGDNVGVGCFIDACLDCVNCEKGDEQYCLKGMTGTYNGEKKHGRCGGMYIFFLTCKRFFKSLDQFFLIEDQNNFQSKKKPFSTII